MRSAVSPILFKSIDFKNFMPFYKQFVITHWYEHNLFRIRTLCDSGIDKTRLLYCQLGMSWSGCRTPAARVENIALWKVWGRWKFKTYAWIIPKKSNTQTQCTCGNMLLFGLPSLKIAFATHTLNMLRSVSGFVWVYSWLHGIVWAPTCALSLKPGGMRANEPGSCLSGWKNTIWKMSCLEGWKTMAILWMACNKV